MRDEDRAGRLSVLLCTQGTYPLARGGVSTWCDLLCRGLPEIAFDLLATTEVAPATVVSTLPANVRSLVQVGQQGDLDRPHWLHGYSTAAVGKRPTLRSAGLEAELVGLLRRLLGSLASDDSAPATAGGASIETRGEETGATVVDLWRLFQGLDWGDCWRSPAVLDAFAHEARELWSSGWHCGAVAPEPSRHDLATSRNTLRRFLAPLHAPLPVADVVHATSTGPSVALGVVAKRERGLGFLLTEHGLSTRERYLRASGGGTPFVRRFGAALGRLWARMGYHHADVIATPSRFNRRWQLELGADPRKLVVIPNGVETPDARVPAAKLGSRPPTVLAVAAVAPIKDIETLIRAAAMVVRAMPRARFVVRGSLDDDRGYAARCAALVHELGLRSAFALAGWSDDREALYDGADVVVLSSISDAHPFALAEAMARGLPVVATTVGGVPEVVGDAGVLVAPRDPPALAAALLELLSNPERRAELGRMARAQAAERLSLAAMLAAYEDLYRDLLAPPAARPSPLEPERVAGASPVVPAASSGT